MIRYLLARRPRGDSGSTLVEVLVSLAVLAVGIGPAFAVFPRSHANAATAQNLQIASQLATDSLEQLRGSDWATLKSGALRHSASYPASPPVTDRITFAGAAPASYTPSGQAAELLVPFASSGSAQPVDYQVLNVDGRQFGVYRFASLRTESCPLISLDQLVGGSYSTVVTRLAAVQTQITAVIAALSTASSSVTANAAQVAILLGATSGSLDATTTAANAALTQVNGLAGNALSLVGASLNTSTATALGTLRSTIGSVKATLATQQSTLASLTSDLTAATTTVTTLKTTITTLTTQLAALNTALNGGLIDLCRLPDDLTLPDLTQLPALTNPSGGASSAAAALDAFGIAGTSTLTGLNSSLTAHSAKVTALVTDQNSLSAKFNTLARDAQSLSGSLIGSVLGLSCNLLGVCAKVTAVQTDENGIVSTSFSYTGAITNPPALAGTTTAINAFTNTFSTQIGSLASSSGVTSLTSAVNALSGGTIPANTVRLAVAVIPLNAPSGVGPTKPVWVSTVVTNPSAGLL